MSACSSSGGIFDAAPKRERLAELDHLSGQPEFWGDQAAAQVLLKERTQIKDTLDKLDGLTTQLDEVEMLVEMGDEEGDEDSLIEADEVLEAVEGRLAQMELERMLSGAHDHAACFVSVNAGAGGTESQDWCSMLLRMLLRYCERKGFKAEITDYLAGEEAGVKSVTFRVQGEYAFGYLKSENGVHRLVRISPFDSQKRRHTSFASVSVLPEIEDDIDVEINEGDLRVDTYRSSGAGGQHVNKTDSAVRLTHKPTGLVVACQAERSQHKNRATAMKLLKAKLFELEMEKRTEERDALYAGKAKIDFGSQIRSYVLQPYQMVKDLRTGYEDSNTKGVLDGDLGGFIEAFLLLHAGE
ncbi:peptide chain release factor 2 [Myxococcota bacterium]|nr:peptide chain release factor 2 [Myxococcota bacterium]MBU1431450.1 peptide chain release factor 2 [Myxococcota bacterium]MBU1896414.1 peptide chain release factor 2 [Myxococcota bacterium]